LRSFCFSLLVIGVLNAQTNKSVIQALIDDQSYAEAELHLKELLDKHPQDIVLLELLGDTYGYQQKWDNAIDIYSELSLLSPDNAELHYKLGGSMGMKAQSVSKFSALGYISGIKSSLKRAIELNPEHIEAHWALIEFYMALPGILGGSSETALSYADDLARISLVDGYLAKGYIYEYDDEPVLAELNYLKAVDVGGSVVCFNKLSEFYEHADQPLKAIQTIETAQEQHQRNALHYQLGKISAEYNVEIEKGLQCLLTYLDNYSTKDGVPEEWAYYRIAQIYRHKRPYHRILEGPSRIS